MPSIFDQYLRGQQAGMQQGQNVLAMSEFARKRQQDDKLRNILSQAYRPPLPAGQGVGPVRPGESLPPVAPQAGGMDMNTVIQRLAAAGMGGKALELQMQQSAAGAPERAARLKDKLSRQRQKDYMTDFQAMFGKGGLTPGQTAKMTPRGLEFGVDPAAAQTADIARQKFQWETGQDTTGQIVPDKFVSQLPPKERMAVERKREEGMIAGKQKRLNSLAEAASSRQAAIKKAEKFRDLIVSGEMKSGATRSALSFMPGVFTKQAQLDEEFNAFAEIAARQALKAAGEIRPTDADVKGMKLAMFGVGRDEGSNITLLNDYIAQQQQDEDEYQSLLTGKKISDSTSTDIDDLVNKYAN